MTWELAMKPFCSIASLALFSLCATAQDVRYNFAANADFTKYRTYRWVEIKGAEKPDQLTDQQIKTAFDEEFLKKGLAKTDSENADLLVGYQVTIGTEKQITMYDTGWGYGPGWGGGWYGGGGGGMTTGQTSTIAIGQIDLDMYDATQKSLVWRGTATKTLDPKAKPDKRTKNLRKGVAKLLKNYPPVSKNGQTG
jgi:hypothetical protein